MTRYERIRSMSLGEMADALIDLDSGGWCPVLSECLEDLDTAEGIPPERCHNCWRTTRDGLRITHWREQ